MKNIPWELGPKYIAHLWRRVLIITLPHFRGIQVLAGFFIGLTPDQGVIFLNLEHTVVP